MAVLDPEELLEQAELLVVPRQPGPPRQVDVRRAISAAYYAVFHHVCIEVADAFVGKTLRRDPRYVRAYRSVDHKPLATACKAAAGAKADATLADLAPNGAFSATLREFAADTMYLQVQRHRADYNPSGLLRAVDARTAISRGRRAMVSYRNSPPDEQRIFLTSLVFKTR